MMDLADKQLFTLLIYSDLAFSGFYTKNSLYKIEVRRNYLRNYWIITESYWLHSNTVSELHVQCAPNRG